MQTENVGLAAGFMQFGYESMIRLATEDHCC